MMTIGERIKQRRKELDLSVDEVARILGKNRATVYRYESDDIENLPISILEPLAKALQTTPGDLLGWVGESISCGNSTQEPPQDTPVKESLINKIKQIDDNTAETLEDYLDFLLKKKEKKNSKETIA